MRGNVLTQKFIKGNGPSLGIHSGGPSPCGQRTPCKPTTQTLPQPASGKGRGERGDPRAHTFPLSAAPFGHRETPTTGEARGALLGGALPTRARAQNSASLAETPGPPDRQCCSHHRPRSHAGHGPPTRCSTGKVSPKLTPRPVSPRLAPRHGKVTKDEARKAGGTYLAEAVPERKPRSALLLARGRQESTVSLAEPCPKAAAATPPPPRRLLQLFGGRDCRYGCGYPGSAALAPPRGGVGPPQTVPGARRGGERWARESLRRNLSTAVGSEIKTSLSPL